MIVSLRRAASSSPPTDIPQRRRVIILGATEAGVCAAFNIGRCSMLVEQQGAVEGCALSRLHEFMPGELRLGARVVAIHTIERRLYLNTRESFIYDKLVSCASVPHLLRLIIDETPSRIRGGEWWSYWLECRGIELLDSATQLDHGDVDGEAGGKRLAEKVRREMALKYAYRPVAGRGSGLFQPRVVTG
jgi:hypothetical protein